MIMLQNTSQYMDINEPKQCDGEARFFSLTYITFVGFVISVILNIIIICAIQESNTLREIEAFLYQKLALWDMLASFHELTDYCQQTHNQQTLWQ